MTVPSTATTRVLAAIRDYRESNLSDVGLADLVTASMAPEYDQAQAEVERLKAALTDAADQVVAADIDAAEASVELDQTKARIRELLAGMRAALAAGDNAAVAAAVGQIAAHVDGEVEAR